jgi:hypothetical protein
MKKLIAAIVLAAMIAPAYADDFSLKWLWEALDMLDRHWLGTVVKNYDPNAWNGVWPNSRMVLYVEPGGVIKEHVER